MTRSNLLHLGAFQLVWFCAVGWAAQGRMWLGPAAVVAFLAVHLALVPRGGRRAELRFVVLVALGGTLLDTLLLHLGATAYPTSRAAWPHPVVPPWITGLWAAFAMLQRFSLAWLARRPVLAAVLGGTGGPLSYLAGARLGAVAVGQSPLLTWGALACEYALLTPLLARLAAARGRSAASP